MKPNCYNSYMESDVKRLCENYKKIQEYVGPNKKVVPILKANASALATLWPQRRLFPWVLILLPLPW